MRTSDPHQSQTGDSELSRWERNMLPTKNVRGTNHPLYPAVRKSHLVTESLSSQPCPRPQEPQVQDVPMCGCQPNNLQTATPPPQPPAPPPGHQTPVKPGAEKAGRTGPRAPGSESRAAQTHCLIYRGLLGHKGHSCFPSTPLSLSANTFHIRSAHCSVRFRTQLWEGWGRHTGRPRSDPTTTQTLPELLRKLAGE